MISFLGLGYFVFGFGLKLFLFISGLFCFGSFWMGPGGVIKRLGFPGVGGLLDCWVCLLTDGCRVVSSVE